MIITFATQKGGAGKEMTSKTMTKRLAIAVSLLALVLGAGPARPDPRPFATSDLEQMGTG